VELSSLWAVANDDHARIGTTSAQRVSGLHEVLKPLYRVQSANCKDKTASFGDAERTADAASLCLGECDKPA